MKMLFMVILLITLSKSIKIFFKNNLQNNNEKIGFYQQQTLKPNQSQNSRILSVIPQEQTSTITSQILEWRQISRDEQQIFFDKSLDRYFMTQEQKEQYIKSLDKSNNKKDSNEFAKQKIKIDDQIATNQMRYNVEIDQKNQQNEQINRNQFRSSRNVDSQQYKLREQQIKPIIINNQQGEQINQQYLQQQNEQIKLVNEEKQQFDKAIDRQQQKRVQRGNLVRQTEYKQQQLQQQGRQFVSRQIVFNHQNYIKPPVRIKQQQVIVEQSDASNKHNMVVNSYQIKPLIRVKEEISSITSNIKDVKDIKDKEDIKVIKNIKDLKDANNNIKDKEDNSNTIRRRTSDITIILSRLDYDQQQYNEHTIKYITNTDDNHTVNHYDNIKRPIVYNSSSNFHIQYNNSQSPALTQKTTKTITTTTLKNTYTKQVPISQSLPSNINQNTQFFITTIINQQNNQQTYYTELIDQQTYQKWILSFFT